MLNISSCNVFRRNEEKVWLNLLYNKNILKSVVWGLDQDHFLVSLFIPLAHTLSTLSYSSSVSSRLPPSSPTLSSNPIATTASSPTPFPPSLAWRRTGPFPTPSPTLLSLRPVPSRASSGKENRFMGLRSGAESTGISTWPRVWLTCMANADRLLMLAGCLMECLRGVSFPGQLCLLGTLLLVMLWRPRSCLMRCRREMWLILVCFFLCLLRNFHE